MKKNTIGIFATSVALCALLAATEASAFGRGGGGHGGGGAHFGGGGGAHFGGAHFGGAHFGGGHFGGAHFGGLHASHGFGGHAISRGFAGHGIARHGLASHNPGTRDNAARLGAVRNGLAAHSNALGTRNNAFAARDGLNGANANRIAAHNFAHNQFARNFHGLHNFNSTGFNRNTFGNQAGWNQWGGNFYGAGWNNWGGGWGGWAGPVFWPFLWGDIFSFAFWPYGYYDPFWAYGPAFFLDSLFAPGPYFGPTYGYGPDYYDYEGLYGYAGSPNIYYGSAGGGPHLDKADEKALARTNTQAMESCGGFAPGVTDLPIAQIKRTVRPTGDQITALDDLNAALSKTSDIVAASCPKDLPLTPVGRLDAAEKRLGAMIEAIDIVRSPLTNFYDSLSDEQKQRFDAMGRSGRAGAPGSNLASLCGQQAGSATNLPIQRIEHVVQPTAQQHDAFNALKQASENAADQLQVSCPTQMPQTPTARLDATEARLKSMLAAMKTVRPKLVAFYDSLSDEQKARFDTMGPPRTASVQQQQSGSQ